MLYKTPSPLVQIGLQSLSTVFACLSGRFFRLYHASLEADIKTLSRGVGVLDLEFFYTPQKALEMLRAYGSEGSRLYLTAQWTVDLIFPLTVGLFVSSALVWAGKPTWWQLGALLTIADWTENILLTVLLLLQPLFSESVAWGSCFFTMLKWSLFVRSYGAILLIVVKKWHRLYLVSLP
jgi:hypothetical protein